jgi:hypothetical protein
MDDYERALGLIRRAVSKLESMRLEQNKTEGRGEREQGYRQGHNDAINQAVRELKGLAR